MDRIKVVLPQNASEYERFACKEFSYFVTLASGAIADGYYEDAYVDNGEPTVFIGDTYAFKKNVTLKGKNEVGSLDGYKIVIKENVAYVCGGAGQGTIFGVYRLLKELFNLVIYADDCFTFDKKPLVLNPIVIEEKPDIPMRTVGVYPVHLEKRNPCLGNKRYCYRMRLRQMDEGWGINNHSYFRLLPPSVYKKEHSDWYDETGKMLCMTNEGCIEQLAENMKKVVEEHPNDQLFMLGMEDTPVYCKCPKCAEITEKYGGFTGLMLYFTNKVVAILNEWLNKTQPERKVYFFTFAYNWCIAPPVKKNGLGGYELLYEDLRPADNLGVLIAPIHTCANYPLNDPRNFTALTPSFNSEKRMSMVDVFEGWRAVVKQIAVWSYNSNFYDYFTPIPMWNGIEEDIRWFKKLDAYHVFIEAEDTCPMSNFAEMKIFVESNLMWDTSLKQDELIRQFMAVWFKGAEHEIYEYFKYIHQHADWLDKNFGRKQIFVHFDDEPNMRWLDKRFLSQEMLFNCLKYFEEALSKNLSETVKNRIKRELMPTQFSILYLYRQEIDKQFALNMLEDLYSTANIFGISYVSNENPRYIKYFYEAWKNELTK